MDMVAALCELSEHQLATLLEKRPDLLRPSPPKTLKELAARATSWSSIGAVFDCLDLLTTAVVEGLVLLAGKKVPVAGLLELLGPAVTPGDLDQALDRLRALGMIRRASDHVELVDGLRERMPYPARLGRPVAALMARQHNNVVSQVAANLGLAAKGKSKAKLLEAIAATLSDPTSVASILLPIGPAAAEIVIHLAAAGPTTVVGYQQQWHGEARPDPRSPAAVLMSKGILATVDWQRVELVREVGMAMRGGSAFPELTPTRPAVVVHAASSPEEARTEAARSAGDVVGLVTALIEEWDLRPPAWLKAGGVGLRDVRRTAKALEVEEPATFLLIELAAAAGLVGLEATSMKVLPTGRADEWLKADPARRWLTLVQGWMASPRVASLAGRPNPQADGKPWPALVPYQFQPAQGIRDEVMAALLELPEGASPEPAGLAGHLSWSAPRRWEELPVDGEALIHGMLSEAAVLGVTGRGALAPSARLALGGQTEEALAEAASVMAQPVSMITLQADLTAIAAGSLAAPVAAALALMAELESKGAATVWRFNQASVGRALDAGRSEQDLLAFLEEHATKGVPQALAYLVSDTARRHGRVRLGRSSAYVRCDDPALLAEVTRSRRTSRLGLRLLAPTVAVTTVSPDAVLAGLRAGGFLPAMEGPDGMLLVAKAARRRAPTPSQPQRPPAARRTDPFTVAASLLSQPQPVSTKSSSPSRSAPPVVADGTPMDRFLLSEPAFDPDDLVDDDDGLVDLFEDAIECGYLVLVGHIAGGSHYTEKMVQPMSVVDDTMIGSVWPDLSPRGFPLHDIEWARPCAADEVLA